MKVVKPYDPIDALTPEEAEELNLQSGPHFLQTLLLESSLLWVFGRRGWFEQSGFSGDLGLKDPRLPAPISPDLYVVKGISHARLNQEKTYSTEGGHPVPSVAIEVGSDFPNERDYQDKKAIYEKLGVAEYYIFDLQSRRLVGYRLSGGKYKELKRNRQGRLPSAQLQLELGEQAGWARFWDEGALVPLPEEVWHQVKDLTLELEQKDQQLAEQGRQLEERDKEIEVLKKILKEKGLLRRCGARVRD